MCGSFVVAVVTVGAFTIVATRTIAAAVVIAVVVTAIADMRRTDTFPMSEEDFYCGFIPLRGARHDCIGFVVGESNFAFSRCFPEDSSSQRVDVIAKLLIATPTPEQTILPFATPAVNFWGVLRDLLRRYPTGRQTNQVSEFLGVESNVTTPIRARRTPLIHYPTLPSQKSKHATSQKLRFHKKSPFIVQILPSPACEPVNLFDHFPVRMSTRPVH